jgi:hypothetical protein
MLGFYCFCLFFQEERFVFHLENAIILILYHISNHTMVAIAQSILDEIFLDEAELNIQYISGALHLIGKEHTQERLIQTLEQMAECGYIQHDADAKTYKRICDLPL